MTSMLYTIGTMNNKPNIPDEVMLDWKNYSFWADMKVNLWLFVAMLTGAASAFLFHTNPPYGPSHHCYYQDWPLMLRAVVELFPLLASLLWARSMARWIRGMDELHRRITLEACLFAVIGTLLVVTAWHRLDKAGVLEAVFRPPSPPLEHWDFRQFAHLDLNQFVLTIVLLWFFYFLGHSIFNRRYK